MALLTTIFLQSQTSTVAVSLMARDGAQRITSDNLADADIAMLENMLAQADALKQRISKILEGRTNHACRENSDIKLKALTPNSISHEDSTVVDELKLELSSSQATEKTQDTNDAKLALDSTMQID